MEKLNSKDYINIGIFTALYLLATIAVSGIVVVPILQILMLPIIALVCGPIYLLYILKVPKFGALTITGIIGSALVGLLVYANVYCFIINISIFLLAELVAYLGKYKSRKLNNLSYIIASFWAIGEAGLPFFYGKYFYDLSVKSGYSVAWAQGVNDLATTTNLLLMILATVICAIISIKFSESIFKKHFKKAGII